MKLFETRKIQNKKKNHESLISKTKRANFNFDIKNKNIEERLSANKQHLQTLLCSSILTADEKNSSVNEKLMKDLPLLYNKNVQVLYENKPGNNKIIGQHNTVNSDDTTKLLKFTVYPDKFLEASKKILLLNRLQRTNVKINKILNKNNSDECSKNF